VRLRTRLFLVIFAITGTGLYFLMDWVLTDLRKRYLEAVEETMVDTSQLLASLLENAPGSDTAVVPESLGKGFEAVKDRVFTAKVYRLTKTRVDMRVYVTDSTGKVVYDSRPGGGDVGQDHSRWRDVRLTLEGKYGARTTRRVVEDPLTSTLHVAAPILRAGKIRGVVVVAKPSSSINIFLAMAKPKIVVAGVLAGFGVVLAGWLLSIWLTVPIQRLSRYAREVGEGGNPPLPRLGASEVSELGRAFEEMRTALEGRRYVEEYVHALTHELKSPLTAMRAAAEILEDDPPEAVRERFVASILREGDRARVLIDRLLALASLESRAGLEARGSVDLRSLCEAVKEDHASLAERQNLSIAVDVPEGLVLQGDALLLRQALGNLLLNALEHSLAGAEVELRAWRDGAMLTLQVQDRGPGVPDWAASKIWERFWSTPRPDGGTKSSGLGLPFVREVARLHGGTAEGRPRSGGGQDMRISLPA
jgi:two-component system, OmpR family, sensor histidine kinase CreC